MTEARRCRHCADFVPSSRPEAWGECASGAAKHGLHRRVIELLAVRADFGCIHWRKACMTTVQPTPREVP